ncbi:uncharacterized protein BP01DRAFT_354956 [Aspergillus saccharolyticus JOP 1030-1]|uniref:Uncharacterized protein n=1 Tax=Aspergillus saccharolyticus JOP 1030-1 TaxID=1450539 RepID=A0A318ZK69_9EURO|nr:hypothetical protein BP01DRAFT_354956 [Aspergillus saccharolyticus JOP 1030-1]PYH47185.1 hypothetical protein BP01DRAFT_354956 [Aspergillus saccharolyticus JOP 1030-1]
MGDDDFRRRRPNPRCLSRGLIRLPAHRTEANHEGAEKMQGASREKVLSYCESAEVCMFCASVGLGCGYNYSQAAAIEFFRLLMVILLL